MTQNEKNHDLDQKEKQIERQEEENDIEEQDEATKGRDWGKFVVGFIFIFFVVVIWYVIDLFVP